MKTWTAVGLVAIWPILSGCGKQASDATPDDATHVAFDFAAWCDVAGNRFFFEKTPLSEIMEVLGGGELDRTGDVGAADFDYFVDFSSGHHLVQFLSNNDMGGEQHALQEVAIRSRSWKESMSGLPHVSLPIHFPFGSSDMSFSELTQKLGRAVDHEDSYAYIYLGRDTISDESGKMFTREIQETLVVHVRDEKIVAMTVDHVSEN